MVNKHKKTALEIEKIYKVQFFITSINLSIQKKKLV